MADHGSVRIIAGEWRRRRLPVVAIDGLRPSPDRVRETLFNWLGDRVEGARCLDLFAGTGALGFEAASRGADWVTLVERDPRALAQLESNREMLAAERVEIVHADALEWIERAQAQFEIVFLDPPFGRFDLAALALRLEQLGRLTSSACVYLETRAAAASTPPIPAHWQLLKSGRAGRVRYYLASP